MINKIYHLINFLDKLVSFEQINLLINFPASEMPFENYMTFSRALVWSPCFFWHILAALDFDDIFHSIAHLWIADPCDTRKCQRVRIQGHTSTWNRGLCSCKSGRTGASPACTRQYLTHFNYKFLINIIN